MNKPEEIIEQVQRRFPLPKDKFSPERKLWLTLYLEGDEDAYKDARSPLHDQGWLNLDIEADFLGFAYPKKEVWNVTSQLCNVLSDALAACQKTGMGIGLIDADTSFDPSVSRFYNLYKSL
jgi:hypothetical protein